MYQTKSNQKEAGAIISPPNLFISGCSLSSEWCIGFLQLQSAAPEPVDSVAAECRLSSCDVCVGSRARRLSCSVACGILVPRPGIKPSPSALEGGFLTTGPPGKSPGAIILRSENIDFKAKFFLVIRRTTSIKSLILQKDTT